MRGELTDQARDCYERAAEAHRRALRACSSEERAECLRMRRHWLRKAKVYEFKAVHDFPLKPK
jgi:regulator of sirC expression with transglutaminase-like and TPR domain